MGKAWAADADDARVHCVVRESLRPLYRVARVQLMPTMLAAATNDADDVRVYCVRCKKPYRLMLLMLAGVVQNGEGFHGRC